NGAPAGMPTAGTVLMGNPLDTIMPLIVLPCTRRSPTQLGGRITRIRSPNTMPWVNPLKMPPKLPLMKIVPVNCAPACWSAIWPAPLPKLGSVGGQVPIQLPVTSTVGGVDGEGPLAHPAAPSKVTMSISPGETLFMTVVLF